MGINISVRRATEADINNIVSFNLAMAMETEGLTLNRSTLVAGVTAVFSDKKKGFYLIVEVDDETRGCLMITYEWSDWRNGMFWWIQSVFVDEGYRRKGLFKSLFKETQSLINHLDGVVGTRLYVEENNIQAQDTYLNMGMNKTNYLIFEKEKNKEVR